MHPYIRDVCSQTKDLINMIDATMVEVVLYLRGETMIYANEEELHRQLLVQAGALDESIGELDDLLRQNREFLDSASPPENVPGQVLAIAEVIVKRIEQFDPQEADLANDFFQSLPVLSRHELMERLSAYYHYLVRATGSESAKQQQPDFGTDPLTPYWW